MVGNLRAPLEGLPRVVIARHERGKTFGDPGDLAEHERVARAAIELLRGATEPTLLDLGATAARSARTG